MLRSFLLYLSEREGPKKLLTGNPVGRRLPRDLLPVKKSKTPCA